MKFREAIFMLLVLLAGYGAAYPEVLFAELSSDPAVPRPGDPFELQVLLTDSDEQRVAGIELEARIVRAASEGASAAGSESARLRFRGAGEGVYRGSVPALAEGRYFLSLAELTGSDRSQAEASTEFRIDGDLPLDAQVVLPASGGGLGSWLAWLLGLPLLAGLLVTLLLLTGRQRSRVERPSDDEAE